jgi:hypothetical protein
MTKFEQRFRAKIDSIIREGAQLIRKVESYFENHAPEKPPFDLGMTRVRVVHARRTRK